MPEKMRACKECAEEKKIIGGGGCTECYGREKKAGTLDKNYPSMRKTAPKKKLAPREVKDLRKAMSATPASPGTGAIADALEAAQSLFTTLRRFDSNAREAIIDAACNMIIAVENGSE